MQEVETNQSQKPDIDETIKKKIALDTMEDKEKFQPENAIDSAYYILQNTEVTDLMPEIEKEIKLGNLDTIDLFKTRAFTFLWQDLAWLKKNQEKKQMEAKIIQGDYYDIEGYDSLMEEIENEFAETPPFFDELGAFRRAIFFPTSSRGKYGFQQEKLVETINSYKTPGTDETEQKPGFLKSMFGGFRR